MTGVKVVDASALAALLFSEPEGAEIARRLEDTHLAAPSLLDYEIANVALKKITRQAADRDIIRAALRFRHSLKIHMHEITPVQALEFAETTGLTAYDASYLWLARTLDAELVTLDRKLATIAAI